MDQAGLGACRQHGPRLPKSAALLVLLCLYLLIMG